MELRRAILYTERHTVYNGGHGLLIYCEFLVPGLFPGSILWLEVTKYGFLRHISPNWNDCPHCGSVVMRRMQAKGTQEPWHYRYILFLLAI